MDALTCLRHAGSGATAHVFKAADSSGKNYAVKIRKPATDGTTAAEDFTGSMEETFLAKLSAHPNIVKLRSRVTGPLPDAFIMLLPGNSRAPFTRMLRGGRGRRPVEALCMDYHEQGLLEAVDRARADEATYTECSLCACCGAGCRRPSTCFRKAYCTWT